jgi:hypothetical protein
VAKDISAWPFSIGSCDSGSPQSSSQRQRFEGDLEKGNSPTGISRWRHLHHGWGVRQATLADLLSRARRLVRPAPACEEAPRLWDVMSLEPRLVAEVSYA